MKWSLSIFLAVLMLCVTSAPALAATAVYPVEVVQSGDGGELRKIYDLGPGEDPAAIPRASFEQAGYRYTLTDILRQDMPVTEGRAYTESVTLESGTKDTEKVLALLPATREVTTEDGFTGVLTLDTSTVKIEAAGYSSSSRTVTAIRSYPSLASADTQYIPKTVQENGRTLTLQNVEWKTDNTANVDDYGVGDRFTAVATYTGTASSTYATGYTVTAEYTGEVGRVTTGKVRYIAVFSGTAVTPPETETPPADQTAPASANWIYMLCIGLAALLLAGVVLGLYQAKKRKECKHETENDLAADPVPDVDYPGVGPGV